MDRDDERKDDRARDEDVARESDRDVTGADATRNGDVLGLGGSAVPKAPDDPQTAYDEDSVAQRRARAAEAEPRRDQRDHDLERGKGATGIDMGSGGSGTDVA